MKQFILWLENKEDIFNIPLSNIWIMHWSCNPIKNIDWVRKNYELSFGKNLPLGRIGDEKQEQFSCYSRLVDSEEYDPYANEYKPVINTAITVNDNYPKIFLDDGTHRAIVALEKNEPFLKVQISNLNKFPQWKNIL